MGNASSPLVWGETEQHQAKESAPSPDAEAAAEAAGEAALLLAEVGKESNDEKVLPPRPDRRYPHIDIVRFMCLMVVVLDHGDPRYSKVNSFFGQNWTLQYIFVICGLSLSLSRQGVSASLLRLALYFVVGVCLNWSAWAIKGLDWRHNFWDVIFQFWFVVALVVYIVLLVPLKSYLELVADGNRRRAHQAVDPEQPALLMSFAMVGAGLVIIYLLVSEALARLVSGSLASRVAPIISSMGSGLEWWAKQSGGAAGGVLMSFCSALELTLSNVWIAVMVPHLLPAQQSITGWLLIANMHIRRLDLWYAGLGEKVFNGFDLMLLGLVCAKLGLKWREPVGRCLARYWFVWISICGLIWVPGTAVRMDLLQEVPFQMRWRMRLLDAVFMVAFLAAGERFFDPRIFTEDKCDFINNLGLLLFLVHKAIHIVLPQPENWYLILLIIGLGAVRGLVWSRPK
mmetsp:Transcript_57139/g.122914  ORF Transcript_57139/g.122914 Transcript_57139/m.122914 type:complete len:456 (+) Transcript_57139:122-1489(+)